MSTEGSGVFRTYRYISVHSFGGVKDTIFQVIAFQSRTVSVTNSA